MYYETFSCELSVIKLATRFEMDMETFTCQSSGNDEKKETSMRV